MPALSANLASVPCQGGNSGVATSRGCNAHPMVARAHARNDNGSGRSAHHAKPLGPPLGFDGTPNRCTRVTILASIENYDVIDLEA